MTTRTLGPRDLDPRTLRVVRRVLDGLSEELQREAGDVRRGGDAEHADGLLSAVHDIDILRNDLKRDEHAARARLRRRQR